MTAPEITRSAERSKNSGIRKYLSFFRIRFTAGFQYRAAALAGIATQFFWGLMEIRMFMAFYRTDPAAFPMGIDAVASYVWLQQATLAMFMMWIFDNSIFEEIKNGGVAVSLCRPCGIYPMWFAQNVSMRLSRAIMRAIPIFVVTAFLPAPYHISAGRPGRLPAVRAVARARIHRCHSVFDARLYLGVLHARRFGDADNRCYGRGVLLRRGHTSSLSPGRRATGARPASVRLDAVNSVPDLGREHIWN